MIMRMVSFLVIILTIHLYVSLTFNFIYVVQLYRNVYPFFFRFLETLTNIVANILNKILAK